MKYIEFMEWVLNRADEDIIELIEEMCEETGNHELFDHLDHVANVAADLAEHYNINRESAYLAGYLHDIARLIDSTEYMQILDNREIGYTEDEMKVPSILHGKVSAMIAEHEFRIHQEELLSAVVYHTTLRKDASDFEKVLFLADKLTWEDDDLVMDIEEVVFQTLNVACFKALDWIKKDIESKDGVLMNDLREAHSYYQKSVLF